MVEKLTLNYPSPTLVDIPAANSDSQLHTPSKLETSVALCCVTNLCILKWPCIVPSTSWTMIMCNDHAF